MSSFAASMVETAAETVDSDVLKAIPEHFVVMMMVFVEIGDEAFAVMDRCAWERRLCGAGWKADCCAEMLENIALETRDCSSPTVTLVPF